MDAEDLRLAVYRAFAETGRAPEPDELAAKLGTEAREVAAGLAELARGRHLALGDQGQIVMAHPFSAVPLGFFGRAICERRASVTDQIADICTPHQGCTYPQSAPHWAVTEPRARRRGGLRRPGGGGARAGTGWSGCGRIRR